VVDEGQGFRRAGFVDGRRGVREEHRVNDLKRFERERDLRSAHYSENINLYYLIAERERERERERIFEEEEEERESFVLIEREREREREKHLIRREVPPY
jgi:Xaa-Pro aminopeptidase